MRRYFKSEIGEYSGDNWLIGFGRDSKTNKDWFVTTNSVHASELQLISEGAKADADLVADLLNWYYNTLSAPKTINTFRKKLEE